jgi:hypothetical protein
VRLEVQDERTIEITLEATCRSAQPVVAHLTLLPQLGQTVETAGGQKAVLAAETIAFEGAQLGTWLHYAGCRFAVPPGASLRWPAVPHNPYRKDGRADPAEGRLVIGVPFDRDHLRQQVTLTVEP